MKMRELTRREMLRLLGASGIALPFLLSACDSGETNGSTGVLLSSKARLPEPFKVALPVPPVLKPVRSDAATDYYEITQKVAQAHILPGLTTEIWGYNGLFPGPTIQSRRNRRIVIRQRNELTVPVVVHLHGGRTAPEHDGYPTDLILPVNGGETSHAQHAAGGSISHGFKDYVYQLDQPATTLWYHDHRMDFTGPQVYHGLAGFHLLHDEQEEALPLPKGEHDIPLMICDRSFNENGSFSYPSIDPTLLGKPDVTGDFMRGVLGDVILVNGAAWPFLEVTNTRYRFRILNASNARRYRLALDPPPREGSAFIQIGSDLGLLGQPLKHQNIEIAQAERFDVVIDFSMYAVGTQVKLLNEFGDGNTRQIMRFDVTHEAKDESSIPSKLVEYEKLKRSDATVTREFHFTQAQQNEHLFWAINEKPFDPKRIDARPQLGATEIWQLTTEVHHPVHLHLAHCQILTRAGKEPGPYDAGWKDTFDLQGGEVVEILARFSGYRGRYVFHCHNLEHEDMMMMSNFEVM
jgi:spore coat protein A